jgi:hypothetical protein
MRLPQRDWRGMMKEEIAGKEKKGDCCEPSFSSTVCTIAFSGTWWMTLGPSRSGSINNCLSWRGELHHTFLSVELAVEDRLYSGHGASSISSHLAGHIRDKGCSAPISRCRPRLAACSSYLRSESMVPDPLSRTILAHHDHWKATGDATSAEQRRRC